MWSEMTSTVGDRPQRFLPQKTTMPACAPSGRARTVGGPAGPSDSARTSSKPCARMSAGSDVVSGSEGA